MFKVQTECLGVPSVVYVLATLASSGSLLVIQKLRLYPRPTESKCAYLQGTPFQVIWRGFESNLCCCSATCGIELNA